MDKGPTAVPGSGMLASMTISAAPSVGLPSPELGQAVHELESGQITIEAFIQVFLGATIYTLSPVCPSVFVMSRPGGSAIAPVWSTLRGLHRVMGGYESLARTGGVIVARVPPGVGVLVDGGLPCPVALPSSLLLGNRCRS